MDGTTNEVEAGGNAVRRTPLVGLLVLSAAGIFRLCRRLAAVGLVLAVGGPFATRLIRPPARRFSWWRRPQAEAATTGSPGELAQVDKATAGRLRRRFPATSGRSRGRIGWRVTSRT